MAKSLFINRIRLPGISLRQPPHNNRCRLTQNSFSVQTIQYRGVTRSGVRRASVPEAHIAFGKSSTPATNQAGRVQAAA